MRMFSSSAKPSRRSPFRSIGLYTLLVSCISCTSLLALWTFGPRSVRVGWARLGRLSPPTATSMVGLTPSQRLAVDQRHTTIFREHTEFMNVSREFDHVWDEALPSNDGFLRIFDPVANKDVWVGVAMFHQLHCLQMIRMTLQNVVEETNALLAACREMPEHETITHHRGDVHSDHKSLKHAMHCFDYLRQSFICLADDTIEMPIPERLAEGVIAVDGAGPRQCRNASKLWELALESG
ncbi:hypothetical protein B0T14DRAFT_524042 [Immersiella caudata]|uniref:Uncharacterized protein n=1 Tax=Immersiella caudata TaxID=314043 RepID=A0AA39WK78_9PEZI|nr:hypothetical protein B0T14DRAFT_524042 [Immersiella caudata]